MKIPMIKNTVTNYITTGVKLLEGILASRWIVEYLGMEQYGLWTLLWSFFIYALLLDFGCGAAAQKYTSGGGYARDIGQFNRIISTIFTFHCAMGVLIAILTVAGFFFLEPLLGIHEPEKLAYAGKCFLLFGFGAALLFPTGIFPEMLIGLQKIYLRNYVVMVTKVCELITLLLVFYFDGGLLILITAGMAVSLFSNLGMAYFVMRSISDFRIKFGIAKDCFSEVAGFSGFIFMGIVARLVLNKSNRLLISIFCGIAQVGIFQLSTKVAELCFQVITQYQENVSPITGALHRRGKLIMLRKILLGSMRWNSYIAVATMLPAFVLMDTILLVLFKVDNPEITFLSRIMIISMFISVTMRTVPHRFLIMADYHRFATMIVVVEAVITLVLNLLLLKSYGIYAIVWVSLGVKLAIGLLVVLPFMVIYLKLSTVKFFYYIFILPAITGIPAIVYLYCYQHFVKLNLWCSILLGGGGAGIIYLIVMFCSLPKSQRHRYQNKITMLKSKLLKTTR